MKRVFNYIFLALFIIGCSKDDDVIENDIDLNINNLSIINVIVDYNLKDIDFLDLEYGYAIDNQGKILKTENSGSNWLEIFSSNFELIDLQFINRNLGFILCKNGNSFSLLKTIDGGNSFQETLIQNDGSLTKIFFVNSDLGFVLGNHVLKTGNTGNTWNELNLEFNVYKDIIETIGGNIYLSGLRGTLFKSNDSGNNWELKNTNSDSHIYEILPFENIFYLIGQSVIKTDFNTTVEYQTPGNIKTHIFDKTTLIGFGQSYPTQGFFPYGAIFISNNSGNNWNTTIFTDYSRINAIDFIDKTNGFAIADNLVTGKSYLIKIEILK